MPIKPAHERDDDDRPKLVERCPDDGLRIVEAGTPGAWIELEDMDDAVGVRE